MKRLWKTMKAAPWWLWLPFGFFNGAFKWIVEPDEYIERAYRMIVVELNAILTSGFICFVLGMLGVFK